MLNDILWPDQIQWQPSTEQTLYKSVPFLPNSTFYRLMWDSHRTFTTGVACWQGTLTPPDTCPVPFGTCICSICWDQSFPELVIFSGLFTSNIPRYLLDYTYHRHFSCKDKETSRDSHTQHNFQSLPTCTRSSCPMFLYPHPCFLNFCHSRPPCWMKFTTWEVIPQFSGWLSNEIFNIV